MDDQEGQVNPFDERVEILKTLTMANGAKAKAGVARISAYSPRSKRAREADQQHSASHLTSHLPSQRQRIVESNASQNWDNQSGAHAHMQALLQPRSCGTGNNLTIDLLAQSANQGSNESQIQQMKTLLLMAASQQQQQQQLLLHHQSHQLEQKQQIRQLLNALQLQQQQQQLLQSQENICRTTMDSSFTPNLLRNQERMSSGASEWQEQLARLLQQQQSNSSLLQQKQPGSIDSALLLSSQGMQSLPNSTFGVQPQPNGSSYKLEQVLQQQLRKPPENKDNHSLLQALLAHMGGNVTGNNLQVPAPEPLQTPLIDAFMSYQQSNLMRSASVPKATGPDLKPASIVPVVHRNIASDSPGLSLSLPTDTNQLSQYQIYIRQNLEFFESRPEDVETNVQGRKKRVQLGQVGIRCIHCADIPIRQRGRGSTYYPLKLSGVYQAAQNMASTHLSTSCMSIPDEVREQLDRLRERRDTAGGGKQYWADSCSRMGLYEDDNGIWFKKDKAEPLKDE